MTTDTLPTTVDLPCDGCGYNLRAHRDDEKCPECGASVAKAREVAKVPIRPAWRDSDPRWRRRMLCGAWILVLVPLIDSMRTFGWTRHVPAWTVFDVTGRSLQATMLSFPGVYAPLAFCIGVALLFSHERGRRRSRLDWTRRWGAMITFVVMLLSAVEVLFICALVTVGIAALFQSMPPKYQPRATGLLVSIGSNYLRYGPHPTTPVLLAAVAASSITVLLACVALYDALRSISPARFTLYVLAPLALFALIHLGQVALYCVYRNVPQSHLSRYGIYFAPELLTRNFVDPPNQLLGPRAEVLDVALASVKWLLVFAVAIWLSMAQIATFRRRRPDVAGNRTHAS